MLAKPRIWAVNGDFVTLKATGVARYAREVTLAMDSLVAEGHPAADGVELTLFTPRAPENLALRSIPVRILPEYRRPRLPQGTRQPPRERAVRTRLARFATWQPC